MACFKPLKGYRSRVKSENGKYPVVFNSRLGNYDQPMDVPCGQCIGCRLERSRQWAVRLIHEKQMHEQSCFLTLTYDPKNLPEHGSLRPKDFQDFMKRLRRWLKHKKIRYYHCGEYGEETFRPHYHAILFGYDFADKQLLYTTKRGDKVYTSAKLDERWGLGQCSIGEVTFESAAYVARYVTKKITGAKADDHYGVIINKETGEVTPRRIPEYTTMSNALGKSWFNKYTGDVFPYDEVVVRGKKMKPPKYYSLLYEQLEPEKHFAMKAARKAQAKKPEVQADNIDPRLRVKEQIANSKLNQLLKRKLKWLW